MTVAAGTKLGPYEIVAPLGAGGMGEPRRQIGHVVRTVTLAIDGLLGSNVVVSIVGYP
jgi:hypothetical protein